MAKRNYCLIFLMLMVVVAMVGLTACGSSNLTMENFDKIQVAVLNQDTLQYEGGMTVDQVKNILGEPTNSASNTMMGITGIAYVWGDDSKNIAVSFVDNRAIMKIQTGLR